MRQISSHVHMHCTRFCASWMQARAAQPLIPHRPVTRNNKRVCAWHLMLSLAHAHLVAGAHLSNCPGSEGQQCCHTPALRASAMLAALLRPLNPTRIRTPTLQPTRSLSTPCPQTATLSLHDTAVTTNAVPVHARAGLHTRESTACMHRALPADRSVHTWHTLHTPPIRQFHARASPLPRPRHSEGCLGRPHLALREANCVAH